MRTRIFSFLAAASLLSFGCNDTKLLGEGGGPTPESSSVQPTPTATASPQLDPIGCSDGTREGFLSQSQYPDIAACAGAWSLPGVSQTGLAPACGRVSGNGSSNPDGTGCSAADLCSSGWHICRGFTEVSAKAATGCADAVPTGSAPGAFFAIAQHSHDHMVCDDMSADVNDVFGCGTMGVTVGMTQNCGPLNAALASTQPNTCGWNQAQPPIGPWQCNGSNSYDEGAFVTKNGCPNHSCSYSGNPIGNDDDGGVLCCRD